MSDWRGGRARKVRGRGRWRKLAFGLPLGLVLAWGAAWIWQHRPRSEAPWFPLRYVRIQGELQYLDAEKLHAALLPVLRASYFSLDLSEVEGVVRAFAWVDGLRVMRVWPDTLVVTVSEHRPVARWGDKALLNERGERFTPPDVTAFASLPQIIGPPGMERVLLDELKRLNKRLENKNLRVAVLDLSKRRAYSLRLSNDLDILMGRQDPAMALDRFLSLAPHLGEERFALLSRVDLRYPNGFAVVWKPAQDTSERPDGTFSPHDGAGLQARETL